MKIGKIPASLLDDIVLAPINENEKKRDDVFIRPQTGEDSSAVYIGDELLVISSDPITGAKEDTGYIAVHINCNDIAASGAMPIGIMLTILLPPTAQETELEAIMAGARKAASELNIEILGGHTEVTPAVCHTVVSGTVIGKAENKKFISTSGAIEGQDVIITKWIGLEGTAIISEENKEKLKKYIDEETISIAISFKKLISVLKEAKIATDFGATCMHDITEGGVLGAAWEVARCSGLGVYIYADNIPVRKETEVICKTANINPYRLISSGSLMITTFEGEKLVEKLLEEGVNAAIIGKVTKKDKLIMSAGIERELKEPDSDELYNVNII
ncbi:MAG: AIR synthase family protein [Lachnospiraceae bacterium]|nr:AIR synthase family protein [Lachnospiraceae bacterium]